VRAAVHRVGGRGENVQATRKPAIIADLSLGSVAEFGDAAARNALPAGSER